MHDDILESFAAALRAEGDAYRAEKEKSYQKSRWEHWGVAFPKMDRVIARRLKGVEAETLRDLARRLWAMPVWDCRIAAGRILALPAVPADDALWRQVAECLPDLDGWAVADNLAKAGGRCLLADPKRLDQVEGWLDAENMWIQRAALVVTLPWTRDGRDPTRMLGWMDRLADDPRWFIQKAIGWWLRELSKRDPDRARTFLDAHAHRLKPVAKKEGGKYL